jgi:hypothetical protein
MCRITDMNGIELGPIWGTQHDALTLFGGYTQDPIPAMPITGSRTIPTPMQNMQSMAPEAAPLFLTGEQPDPALLTPDTSHLSSLTPRLSIPACQCTTLQKYSWAELSQKRQPLFCPAYGVPEAAPHICAHAAHPVQAPVRVCRLALPPVRPSTIRQAWPIRVRRHATPFTTRHRHPKPTHPWAWRIRLPATALQSPRPGSAACRSCWPSCRPAPAPRR